MLFRCKYCACDLVQSHTIKFNLLSIDKLGNCCLQWLVGALQKYKAQQGGSMATLWAGNSPAGGHQPALSGLNKLQNSSVKINIINVQKSMKINLFLAVKKVGHEVVTVFCCVKQDEQNSCVDPTSLNPYQMTIEEYFNPSSEPNARGKFNTSVALDDLMLIS